MPVVHRGKGPTFRPGPSSVGVGFGLITESPFDCRRTHSSVVINRIDEPDSVGVHGDSDKLHICALTLLLYGCQDIGRAHVSTPDVLARLSLIHI